MKYIRNWISYPLLVMGAIVLAIGMVLRHGLDGTTIRMNKMSSSLKKD